MDDYEKLPGRYFMNAARAAAAEARRLKKENPVPVDIPKVFVVRVPPTNRPFSWEIRRYGSLVLRRGVDQFGTADEARVAGEAALADLAMVPDHDRVTMATAASNRNEVIPHD